MVTEEKKCGTCDGTGAVARDGGFDACPTCQPASQGETIYYLLDARSCVGNCALWWAPGGKGYVCDLRDAGKFTEKEAFSHRDTDVPVPCEVAEAAVVHHVRVDTPAIGDYFQRGNNAHLRAMGKRVRT